MFASPTIILLIPCTVGIPTANSTYSTYSTYCITHAHTLSWTQQKRWQDAVRWLFGILFCMHPIEKYLLTPIFIDNMAKRKENGHESTVIETKYSPSNISHHTSHRVSWYRTYNRLKPSECGRNAFRESAKNGMRRLFAIAFDRKIFLVSYFSYAHWRIYNVFFVLFIFFEHRPHKNEIALEKPRLVLSGKDGGGQLPHTD